jgi:hypothetical protein
MEFISNILEALSASVIRDWCDGKSRLSSHYSKMMEAQIVSETLENNSILTRLIARKA